MRLHSASAYRRAIAEAKKLASNGQDPVVEQDSKPVTDGPNETNGIDLTAKNEFRARQGIQQNPYDKLVNELIVDFEKKACELNGHNEYVDITKYFEDERSAIVSVLASLAPLDIEANNRKEILRAVKRFLRNENPANTGKQVLLDSTQKVEDRFNNLEKLFLLRKLGLSEGFILKLIQTLHTSETQNIVDTALVKSSPPEELNGFFGYELASKDDKDIVDNLVKAFSDDAKKQTYEFKGKLIEFLETRRIREEKNFEADTFLKNITELKNHVYSDTTTIDGVGRLLENVLSNFERPTNEQIGGFYTEARVALSFIDNGRKVTHLSLDHEIDKDGRPLLQNNKLISLVDKHGERREIDIVIDNCNFIEVKTTGQVLKNTNFRTDIQPRPNPQAVALAQIAIRKGVDYSIAIEHYPSTKDVKQKVIDVRKLIKDKSNIEVTILDQCGRDITALFSL